MERRDSLASVSDSEVEGETSVGGYTSAEESVSSSSVKDSRVQVQDGGQLGVVQVPRTLVLRPKSPHGSRDPQRRTGSGVKRQAPQPPCRPPLNVTPGPVSPGGAPITTVHMQLTPVMPSPESCVSQPHSKAQNDITKVFSKPNDSSNPASQPTHNITRIISEPVQSPAHPPPQQTHRIARIINAPVTAHTTATSHDYGDARPILMSRSRPMSPPGQMPHDHVLYANQQMTVDRPMSPTPPMMPQSRPMSPPRRVLSPQPMSPPGPVSPARPMSPTQAVSVNQAHTPAASQRCDHGQFPSRNPMIRLIDEESDSEAALSDVNEEYCVKSGQPLQRDRNIQMTQQQMSQGIPNTRSPLYNDQVMTGQENYDYYSSFDDSPTQSCTSPIPENIGNGDGVTARGRAKRLMHSSSDPGVARPQFQQHYVQQRVPQPQQQPQPQPPRGAPSVAVPPPLDHLSEEDELTPSDLEDRMERVRRGRLERTDSLVTVAHLYEDLLVSTRFKIRVTLTNLTVVTVVAALVIPNTASVLYTVFRLVFGTLFPAYYSYKAVKTKNVKEYVKWMMYWIVFAFFTCFETFTDLFLSFWFPFYYELKILVVLWLLSPATRGSSILYRKFVHPWLTRREDDIDNCIAQAKQQGYSTVIQLGTKGVNYATTVLMQTAIKGGGGLVNQLRRSYSSGELTDGDMNRNVKALPHIPDDDYDDHLHSSGSYESEPPRVRAESDAAYRPRGSSASRGIRSTKTRSADVSDVYYHDVPDDAIQRRRSPRTQDTASRILSADDLTSGYSSGDPDAGDLIYDLRPDTAPNTNLELTSEPRRSTKVRRTQSLSASTLALHRSQRPIVRRAEGRGGLRSGSAGRGSAPVDDLDVPASYSSSGHPTAPHHGSSFKRSRPGEISAYATLPRTSKRTNTKKRQV